MKTPKIIFAALILVFATSCNKDDLAELNKDTKNPTTTKGEFLFSNAQQNMADQMANTNVNRNIWRLWSEYWTETQYPDESQYLIERRNVPSNVWQEYYRDVLQDLKRAETLLSQQDFAGTPEEKAGELNNKVAMAEILAVYVYHRMVTIWGNIPYSQALNIEETTTPSYDDAQTVYGQLLTRLDNAIGKLNTNYVGYSSAEDYMLDGDVAAWITFANSLKLKMAVTIADVDGMNPGQIAADAIAAGVIGSSAENVYYEYSTTVPYTNPLWEDLVASGRNDFVAANTIVDKMNDLNDPRRPYYFDSNITDGSGVVYVGGIYGTSNSWANFSHVGTRFFTPEYDHPMMTYSEVLFYQAEMAARQLISGDPAALYNQAITESMLEWSTYGGGEAISQTDIDAYLASSGVDYGAVGDWKEAIGTQAWLAFYNRGYEGWTTWRRLDAPTLNAPPDMDEADIPVRFFYPIVEQTTNGASYSAAAAAIGGDVMSTKLFWDVN